MRRWGSREKLCSIRCWIIWMIRVELVLYIYIYIYICVVDCLFVWTKRWNRIGKPMKGFGKGTNEPIHTQTRFCLPFHTAYRYDSNLLVPFRFFNSENENTLREFHSGKSHISVVYLYDGRVWCWISHDYPFCVCHIANWPRCKSAPSRKGTCPVSPSRFFVDWRSISHPEMLRAKVF